MNTCPLTADEGLAEGLTLPEGLRDALGLADLDGLWLGEAESETDNDGLTLRETLREGEREGDADRLADFETLGLADLETLGETDGETDGLAII